MPRAPIGLVASDITSSSVRLMWSISGEEPVTSYVVQYKLKHAPHTVTHNEFKDITTTDYLVTSLDAFTNYEFRVIAVNNIGRGLPSAALDVSTSEKGAYTYIFGIFYAYFIFRIFAVNHSSIIQHISVFHVLFCFLSIY